MAEHKWVYDFAEGSKKMRELLGGKGANVAEMTRVLGASRVPAGFTITTEACVAYMRSGSEPDGLEQQVAAALTRLEETAGKKFGDDRDPLLVSVRSGARESMPGMLDTILNVGLNDASVEGLASVTDNERFAWDSYRRLVQMFGNVVEGLPGKRFEDAIATAKRDVGVQTDAELPADALKRLVEKFKGFYDFPQDPQEQLRRAIRAVFDSWTGERAVSYRRINRPISAISRSIARRATSARPAFINRLVAASESGSSAASVVATRAASSRSESSPTNLQTRPISRAGRASIHSLDSMAHMASSQRPLAVSSTELPASGASPRAVKGRRNRADSAASTKSKYSSIVTPIPTASPLTAAINGFSQSARVDRNRANSSPAADRSSAGTVTSSNERSAPAENALPVPVTTITRTSGSPPASAMANRKSR